MIPLRDDNPTTGAPVLTVALIAVNALVFLYQLSLSPRAGQLFVYQFGAIPAVLFGSGDLPSSIAVIPPVLSLFTSMFLHAGWLHLIGNMWYLWIFGDNVEEAMGRVRFLVFYLLAGLIAALTHALFSIGSDIPMIGASGAISGVLGAYLILYPRARVLVLLPLLWFYWRMFHIPAMFVLGLWFLLQILNGGLDSGAAGGVAWTAHVGGFVAGMLLVGIFKRSDVHFFNPPHRQVAAVEDPWLEK
jgi:membrane associated rhomboid family serine protease